MKFILKYIMGFAVLMSFISCKKTEGFSSLTDNIASIPVTVSNATEFRPGPTVRSSLADAKIQIILSIPASSGRTIKEITRVSASTTYTQVQGTTGLYNTAPIPGSGTTVTFNTTHSEYVTRAAGSIPAANAELAKRFFFLLTLDDGSTIVTSDVRVLIVP